MEKKNNISLVGILFLIYMTFWTCDNSNRYVLYGGYALVVVVTLIKLFFSERGTIIELYTPTKQLFLFMCFCVASFFWAINGELAMDKILFIVPCVFLVIIMTNYFTKQKSVNVLLLTVATVGTVLALYVIVSEGGLSGLYQKSTSAIGNKFVSGSRVGGDINNVNYIGVQCAYSAVVIFFYAFFYKKIFAYLVAIIPTMVVVTTGSKIAFLMLVGGFLMVLYYHQKEQKNIQKYLKILVGIFVLILLTRLILSLDIMYTMKTRLDYFIHGLLSSDNAGDGSTQMRFDLVIEGLKQFWNAPALGIGLGNTPVLYSSKLHFAAYAHNDYIEHLVNGGLIGFVLYYRMFWYYIKEYRKIMKKGNDPKVILSYILMMLLLLQNISGITYYNEMLTYLFFILWTVQIELKKDNIELGNNTSLFNSNSN